MWGKSVVPYHNPPSPLPNLPLNPLPPSPAKIINLPAPDTNGAALHPSTPRCISRTLYCIALKCNAMHPYMHWKALKYNAMSQIAQPWNAENCNVFKCNAMHLIAQHWVVLNHISVQWSTNLCNALQCNTHSVSLSKCAVYCNVCKVDVQIAEWRFVQWCSTIPDPACHPSGVHQMQFYAFYYIPSLQIQNWNSYNLAKDEKCLQAQSD